MEEHENASFIGRPKRSEKTPKTPDVMFEKLVEKEGPADDITAVEIQFKPSSSLSTSTSDKFKDEACEASMVFIRDKPSWDKEFARFKETTELTSQFKKWLRDFNVSTRETT